MADIVHTVVFVTGLALLVVQRIQLKSQEGLNEAVQKPDFDQVRGRMCACALHAALQAHLHTQCLTRPPVSQLPRGAHPLLNTQCDAACSTSACARPHRPYAASHQRV